MRRLTAVPSPGTEATSSDPPMAGSTLAQVAQPPPPPTALAWHEAAAIVLDLQHREAGLPPGMVSLYR